MAVMLWNKDKTGSIKGSKIRKITIKYDIEIRSQYYTVKGWYNANESFSFGCFPTEQEAIDFVEGLHEQMKDEK